MSGRRGFTLVELLVALFVTAILFALGYGAINQAIQNRGTLELQQRRLVALQRTMRLLVQDFGQVAPRGVRDAVGNGFEPAVWGNPTPGVLAAVTRSGWANPAGVQRASLQRVRWLFSDGRLRREVRPGLDSVAAEPSRGRDVLEGVRAARIRFMNENRDWVDVWPTPDVAGLTPTRIRSRPMAVEVSIDLEDWGTVTRIIEVAR